MAEIKLWLCSNFNLYHLKQAAIQMYENSTLDLTVCLISLGVFAMIGSLIAIIWLRKRKTPSQSRSLDLEKPIAQKASVRKPGGKTNLSLFSFPILSIINILHLQPGFPKTLPVLLRLRTLTGLSTTPTPSLTALSAMAQNTISTWGFVRWLGTNGSSSIITFHTSIRPKRAASKSVAHVAAALHLPHRTPRLNSSKNSAATYLSDIRAYTKPALMGAV